MTINPTLLIDQEVVVGQVTPQQCGLDLHIEKIEAIEGEAEINAIAANFENVSYREIEIGSDRCFHLTPGQMYRLTFSAKVRVPANMMAMVIHRSSLLRSGAFIFSAIYDPGFEGNIGAFMFPTIPIKIEKRARLAQIVFLESDSREKYNGRYQNT